MGNEINGLALLLFLSVLAWVAISFASSVTK